MNDKPLNVLFLCTGNSARSIMAEALLRQRGRHRFTACSAGSVPRGGVHPLTIETLGARNIKTDSLYSKGWMGFAGDSAPPVDVVITVCDQAAGEACPLWPDRPLVAHWGVADPDRPDLGEAEQRRLFERVLQVLDYRVRELIALPLERLDRTALQRELDRIGRSLPDHNG